MTDPLSGRQPSDGAPRRMGERIGDTAYARLIGPDAPRPGTREHDRLVDEVARGMRERAEAKRRARGLPPAREREPDCPACDDVGWLPSDDGFYPCKCTVRANRRARQRNMGLGEADRGFVLDAYSPVAHHGAADALAVVRGYVQRWSEHRRTGRGLYLWGAAGVGKTHLGVGATMDVMEDHGVSAVYAPTTRLMRAVSDFSGRDERIDPNRYIERVSSADLLMLDDLSAARMTEYRREVLYEIVDARWADRLPTIVTANVPVPGLRALLGEPVMSRIGGSCVEVHVEGEDMRLRASGEEAW